MKLLRSLKWTAVSLACWGILLPQMRVHAAGPVESEASRTQHLLERSAAMRQRQVPAPPAGGTMVAERQMVVRAQSPVGQVVDVALTAGGTLTGLVIDTDGYAVAGIPVAMYQDGQQLVTTITNESGYFAITNLMGGVYQIVAGDGQTAVRLWAENTAPPGSQTQATVVVSSPAQGPLVGEACETCEEERHLGVDVITLTLLGLAIAGLVIALDDDDETIFVPVPATPH